MPETKSQPSRKINSRANDVVIYGEIGAGGTITAEQLRARIDEIDEGGAESINVRLNSYGGEVFEGLAMAHTLATAPIPVDVHIDGIAASIASVLAVAGGSVRSTSMARSAQLMIHNSWTELRFIGDAATLVEGAKSLERMTGVLESIDAQIVNAYARKTRLPEDTLRAYMKEETWFDAPRAQRLGFVDEVSDPVAACAACVVPAGLFKNFVILGERRVRKASEDYARGRIEAGRFNATAAWSFDAADGDEILGADGGDWERYGQAHLAENEESEPDTKARFSYPFAKLEGDSLVVYRSALAAIRQRSSAEDDGNIYTAAGRLLDLMDEQRDASAAARRRYEAGKIRVSLSQARPPIG